MSQVYTFDRSKNVTLNALKRIITGANGLSPREEWIMNAELILEPVGWDALWKLSKDMCKKYDVRYPCVVYVSVEGVDFSNLSAELSVMGVQHEAIELPDAISGVPLMQLWPTVRQPNTAIDVERTAEFIDLMRFFYTYIWMPWDELDERPLCGGTLEARVALYAAVRDKRIPCRAARAIAALRSDAADTLARIREAEGELNRCADISDDDSLISPMTVSTLADLHAQLERLRARWTVFESPALRDAYIASMGSKCSGQGENVTTLVWNGGPLHELQILHDAAKLLPASSIVRVSGSLQEALAADAERLMLVGGSHELGGGPLPPLWIMGVGGERDVTLMSADPNSSLLNVTEGATLTNLRLSSHQVSTILLVQHQPVTLKDCQLVEDSSSEKEPSGYVQGCVVFPGGSLRMENCKMKRFYTGIVVHKGASVELVGCDISWCGVGVQVYAGAELHLVRCRLTHCTEHALRYEAANAMQHTMDGVTIQDCTIGDGDSEHDFTIVKQDLAILPHADGYEELCIPN